MRANAKDSDVTHARSAPSVAEEAKVPFILLLLLLLLVFFILPLPPPIPVPVRVLANLDFVYSTLLYLSDPIVLRFVSLLLLFPLNSFADKLFKVFSASSKCVLATLLYYYLRHSLLTRGRHFDILGLARFRYKTDVSALIHRLSYLSLATFLPLFPFYDFRVYRSLLCIVYIIRSCIILSLMGFVPE